MTNKQKAKLRKRAHIAAAIDVQSEWIKKAGLAVPVGRRSRDRWFTVARERVNGMA